MILNALLIALAWFVFTASLIISIFMLVTGYIRWKEYAREKVGDDRATRN